jgi:hypothetical protein
MSHENWIGFEGYEGRLDPNYRGIYTSPGIRYPYVERTRSWDIVRVEGEPVAGVYRVGTFTILSRGHDMMKKAHDEAGAYRLHFKRCGGVGVCADIGHPGGPRRSMAQALPHDSLARSSNDHAPPNTSSEADAISKADRVSEPAVQPADRDVEMERPDPEPDWIAALAPIRATSTRTLPNNLEVSVIPLEFQLWDGLFLGMREDCNKRGGRVIGDEGELSCAEVEIVKRLRKAGWDAWWVQAFKCGRARWSAYIRDVPNFPDVVRRIQLSAGEGVGHPDVIAWSGDRVVAIESKSPTDKLRESQIAWFAAALEAGVASSDIGVVEWRVTSSMTKR